jgi:hypothetical protein
MQMRRLLHVLTAGVGVGVFLSGRPALAMPNFAQATGLQCSACHLSVPGLNANGRYVQRTAFTAIPMKTLERALPIWFSEQATYDSQAGYEPHRVQFGNANFHLSHPAMDRGGRSDGNARYGVGVLQQPDQP